MDGRHGVGSNWRIHLGVSDVILTPAQLFELTGYRQPSAQLRWLKANGFRHFVRADGKPVVLEVDLAGQKPVERAPVEPDFAALAESH